MTDAVVVSGAGSYADPWHPFPDTSERLAQIVAGLGYTVTVRDNVETALAKPGPCRLLVVNVGNPATPRPPAAIDAVRAGLEHHLALGGSLLGIHAAAMSLTTLPQWPTILGGQWVHGHSMHPPQSTTTVAVTRAEHPVTAGLTDFTVHDERYSYLRTEPGITVLCEHMHDERPHPLAWARPSGPSRVVYDGLGHDTASYDSPGHVALLRRAVRWLLHDL